MLTCCDAHHVLRTAKVGGVWELAVVRRRPGCQGPRRAAPVPSSSAVINAPHWTDGIIMMASSALQPPHWTIAIGSASIATAILLASLISWPCLLPGFTSSPQHGSSPFSSHSSLVIQLSSRPISPPSPLIPLSAGPRPRTAMPGCAAKTTSAVTTAWSTVSTPPYNYTALCGQRHRLLPCGATALRRDRHHLCRAVPPPSWPKTPPLPSWLHCLRRQRHRLSLPPPPTPAGITGMPLPDYWLAVLWARTMGPR